MAKDKKYSRLGLVASALTGHLAGGLIGTLEGVVGSLVVPTSARMANDNLDTDLNDVFRVGGGKNIHLEDASYYIPETHWKLCKLTYYATRLTTRFGIHATSLYKSWEDISNGGGLSWGLLLIPNVISAVYEVKRFIQNKKSRELPL